MQRPVILRGRRAEGVVDKPRRSPLGVEKRENGSDWVQFSVLCASSHWAQTHSFGRITPFTPPSSVVMAIPVAASPGSAETGMFRAKWSPVWLTVKGVERGSRRQQLAATGSPGCHKQERNGPSEGKEALLAGKVPIEVVKADKVFRKASQVQRGGKSMYLWLQNYLQRTIETMDVGIAAGTSNWHFGGIFSSLGEGSSKVFGREICAARETVGCG